MLKRIFRFHGHGSLQAAYVRGGQTRGQLFSFKLLRRRHGQLRVAVVVSTKVSKKAPVRNRIRRRIYELVRLHVDQTQPVDLVITVYAATAAETPAADLAAQFLALCHQAGVPMRQKNPDSAGS